MSDSESDDELFMLTFVDRASSSTVQQERRKNTKTFDLDNQDAPTNVMAREYRKQEALKARKKEQKMLLDLTLQNLEAAKSRGISFDETDEALSNAKEIKGSPKDTIQLQEGLEKGDTLCSSGKFSEALEVWTNVLQQHNDTLKSNPKLAMSLIGSMGIAYLKNGETRYAISYLDKTLAFAKQAKDTASQKKMLELLEEAYNEVGEMTNAKACIAQRKRLDAPRNKNGTKANVSLRLTPQHIKLLDNTVEKCIDGNFDGLNTILSSQSPLVSVVLNYQHSVSGVSPLMASAMNGSKEKVEQLLNANANIDSIDKLGNNALVHAANNKFQSIVSLLLEQGATLTKEQSSNQQVKAFVNQVKSQNGISKKPKSGQSDNKKQKGSGKEENQSKGSVANATKKSKGGRNKKKAMGNTAKESTHGGNKKKDVLPKKSKSQNNSTTSQTTEQGKMPKVDKTNPWGTKPQERTITSPLVVASNTTKGQGNQLKKQNSTTATPTKKNKNTTNTKQANSPKVKTSPEQKKELNVQEKKKQTVAQAKKTMVPMIPTVAHIRAKKMGAKPKKPPVASTNTSAAAARGELKDRDLQKWNATQEDGKAVHMDEEEHDANWDQFEANKELFGVDSSFPEELYTSKLDTKNLTPEMKAKAEKLAKEMEQEAKRKSKTVNEVSEESKHSAVDRTTHNDEKESTFTDAAVARKLAK